MDSIEQKIENRISNIDITKYHTLKRLCQNVAEFINVECTPHTSIEITSSGFTMNEAITNRYLNEIEKE